eukprot:6205321-Pleurochrysis_carterae.AAC.1
MHVPASRGQLYKFRHKAHDWRFGSGGSIRSQFHLLTQQQSISPISEKHAMIGPCDRRHTTSSRRAFVPFKYSRSSAWTMQWDETLVARSVRACLASLYDLSNLAGPCLLPHEQHNRTCLSCSYLSLMPISSQCLDDHLPHASIFSMSRCPQEPARAKGIWSTRPEQAAKPSSLF